MSNRAKWLFSSAPVDTTTNGNGTRYPYVAGLQQNVGHLYRVKVWEATSSSLQIAVPGGSQAVTSGVMISSGIVTEESQMYPPDILQNSHSISSSGVVGAFDVTIGVGLQVNIPIGFPLGTETPNYAPLWSASWYVTGNASGAIGGVARFNTYMSSVDADLDVYGVAPDESGTATFYIEDQGPFDLYWRSYYEVFTGFAGPATVSGSITFNPNEYWPYADPDGNPIYDITTGDVLPNRDPLN